MPVSPARPGDRDSGRRSGELVLAGPELLAARQLAGLRVIYEQAFPAHLRVPLAELAADSPRDKLLVALDAGDPVGFAALRLLSAPRWAFLRYFGIAASRRRSGIGLRFWQLLIQQVTDIGWPGRIALEVEDPAYAAGDLAEHQVRLGRIGFWTRCGASPLPVTGYTMPALTDIGHSEPMQLMAFDPGAGRPSRADVADLVLAIFSEHYGLPEGHPIVLAALESMGARGG